MNRPSHPILHLGLVAAAAFGTALCYRAFADPGPRLDAHRALADPLQIDNLTVWPLVTEQPLATGRFTTLAEALDKGAAVIREKGAEVPAHSRHGDRRADRAEVNELMIENRGEVPIFVPGGTVLKGGKQDRQLGQDIVIAARATVPVEAFCIERGRWNRQRAGAPTGGRFEVPKVMAAKRIRSSAQYNKSQGEVWKQVDEVNAKAKKAPATGTFLATVDDKDQRALDVRRRLEEAIYRHFVPRGDGQAVVGFAYAVNGEPLAVRTFANEDLFRAHFEPFVRTMSLEAQVARERRGGDQAMYDQVAPVAAVLALIEGIGRATPKTVDTPAFNRNRTRVNEWGGHAACQIPDQAAAGGWLTLSEDWTAPAEIEGEVEEMLMRLDALGYTGG